VANHTFLIVNEWLYGPINTKLRDPKKLYVLFLTVWTVLCCVVNPIICSLIPSFPPCDSGVTAIWASSRFGHPHSPNPNDIGIPFSYYLSDLG